MMAQLTVVDRRGERHQMPLLEGPTLMEAIRNSGVDELLALCGGCCSCATCHVYIDTAYLTHLTPMSADECDLLESSDHKIDASRLACQIPLTRKLDGLLVRIAPED